MTESSDKGITILADGLCFPEGPVWMKDGSVIVTEVGAGKLTRICPDGRKETVALCNGGPNGAAIGPDGMLYVCNNGGMICYETDGILWTKGEPLPDYEGGWIDRIDPTTGMVDRLYDKLEGRRLAGPNDIVFDAAGGFWFTDFGKHSGHFTENGGIYYALPDGSSIKRIIDGPRFNGIGLSPDGRTLYAALSFESLLVGFDVTAPGVLDLSGGPAGRAVGQFKPQQHPDSLAVDALGNICAGLCMVDPGVGSVDPKTGKIVDHDFDDKLTTNICFGGDDMQDAWVTLSTTGCLAKLRWNTPGLKLAYYA